RRALARGGQVMISMPNVAHLWMRLSLLAGRFEYAERGILDRTHLRFYTRRTLMALVTGAGLRIARLTATPVPLYQMVPTRWHGRALAAVHALSAHTARALPRLLAYQFLVGATHDRERSPRHDRAPRRLQRSTGQQRSTAQQRSTGRYGATPAQNRPPTAQAGLAAPAPMNVRSKRRAPKIVVVMPAYNAGRTLRMTYEQLPKDTVNLVI